MSGDFHLNIVYLLFVGALRQAQRPTPDPEPIEGAGRNDKKEMKTK